MENKIWSSHQPWKECIGVLVVYMSRASEMLHHPRSDGLPKSFALESLKSKRGWEAQELYHHRVLVLLRLAKRGWEPHAPKGGFYWSFHRTPLAFILKLPREKALPRTAHRYEEWPRIYEMTNQFHLISCCRWRNGLVQQSYRRWTPLKICFLIFSSWRHSCLVQHIHQRPTPSQSNSKRWLTSLSICLSHRRERRK